MEVPVSDKPLMEVRAIADHAQCRAVSALTAYLHGKLPHQQFEETVCGARQAFWNLNMAEAAALPAHKPLPQVVVESREPITTPPGTHYLFEP